MAGAGAPRPARRGRARGGTRVANRVPGGGGARAARAALAGAEEARVIAAFCRRVDVDVGRLRAALCRWRDAAAQAGADRGLVAATLGFLFTRKARRALRCWHREAGCLEAERRANLAALAGAWHQRRALRRATVAWNVRSVEQRASRRRSRDLVRLGRQAALRRLLHAWRGAAADASLLRTGRGLEGLRWRSAALSRRILSYWQSCVHLGLYQQRLSCIWADDRLRKRAVRGWRAAAAAQRTTVREPSSGPPAGAPARGASWRPQPAGRERVRARAAESTSPAGRRDGARAEFVREMLAWGQAGLEKKLLLRFMCRKALSVRGRKDDLEDAQAASLARLLHAWSCFQAQSLALHAWARAVAVLQAEEASCLDAERRGLVRDRASSSGDAAASWEDYGFPTFHRALVIKSRSFSAWSGVARDARRDATGFRRKKDALLCELKGLFSLNRFEQVADRQFAVTRVRDAFCAWTAQVGAAARLGRFAARLGVSRVLLQAMCAWAVQAARKRLARYQDYTARNTHQAVAYCRSVEAFDQARRAAAPRGADGTPQSSPLAPEQLFCETVCDRSAAAAAHRFAPEFSCPEAQALRLAGAELEAEAGTPEPRSGKVDSVLTRYLSPAPTGTPPERRAGLARCLATLKARQSLAKELKAASPTGPLSPGGFSCASTPSPLQRPPCRPGVA